MAGAVLGSVDFAAAPIRLAAGVGRWAGELQAFVDLIALETAKGGGADARRLALRVAGSPFANLGWLRSLNALCAECRVAATPFDLARKPTRRLLHRALSPAQRIRLLQDHYRLLLAALGPVRVRALLEGGRIALWSGEGRNGAVYRLVLSRSLHFRQEGELSLTLLDGAGRTLASLNAVAGALGAGPADLLIGGLQGCTAPDAKAATVEATKALHGLRPKDLLIHAAYALKTLIGARAIMAIGNDHHVHRRAGGARAWAADYDAYWRELGGLPVPGGFFELPPTRARRAVEEVAPAKRKAWRLRQALIDDLAAAVGVAAEGAPLPKAA